MHQRRQRRARTSLAAAAMAAGLVGATMATAVAGHAATVGCQVSYTVSSQWQGGFGANVSITNLGNAISNWTLTWSFAAGQTITQLWNGSYTQSGAQVTVTNASYNGSLATGGNTSFGFNGAWNTSNPAPTSFTLNGTTCTGTVTGTSTPSASPTSSSPSPSPSASATSSPSPSASPTTTPTGPPPVRTVRVFWLKPTDVAFDPAYPNGIAGVMQEAQRFYKAQLGKTFTLNTPVVEVVNGLHDTNWYITNNCTGTDHYWCVVFNMQAELQQRFGLNAPDSRWLIVGEVSAEEVGQSGGGGGGGWVILSGHDADGAAGKNGAMDRWYGGMVHELGHAFGLPDAATTDGTCMSASLYNYPNCVFNQTQKNGILNGPYASFLS